MYAEKLPHGRLLDNFGNPKANTCQQNPHRFNLGASVLGLCWVQLTETKTNASNSSGDWMTQVNRVVAHTSVALVRMSICPISF